MDTPQQPSPDPDPTGAAGQSPHRAAATSRPVAPGQPPAQVVYLPHPMGPIRRWTSWLGWVGFFICLAMLFGLYSRFQDYFDSSGGIQERFHSRSKTATDKVAVINVRGLISSGEGFAKRQIDRVRKDEKIKAVVLRVDSPGGTISGSDYIYHHLRKLKQDRKIPIVVSMGSMAASGGYYVAMAVGDDPQTIYAEPTTTTGSIGVIIPHYDVSGLLDRFDVKDDSIVSHPRKKMLSMTRPISSDDRQVLENYLQEAFTRFKDVVKSGRPAFREAPEKLDELATGEIFTANQAKQSGLVDEVGFVEDAIDRAIAMADLDKEKVRVVTYRAPLTLMDAFTAARAPDVRFDVDSLLELTVPKAYYLVSSMPPLVSTHGNRER